MLHNIYAVVDPKGDRPYISSNPPYDLDRRGGAVKVYRYQLYIPDPVSIDDDPMTTLIPEDVTHLFIKEKPNA